MIYQYTLAPIESILESVFIILSGITGSYFFGLVLLAVVVRLVTPGTVHRHAHFKRPIPSRSNWNILFPRVEVS